MYLLQLGLIGLAFCLARGLRLVTRKLTDPLAQRGLEYIARYLPSYFPNRGMTADLGRTVPLAYAWLLLLVIGRIGGGLGYDWRLVGIAATLTALWVVLRLSALLFRDALLARCVTVTAWIIAAL